MMNIIPLNDRILVRSSTDPATAPCEHEQGTVIAAGTGELKSEGPPVPLAIKAGDTVVFDSHIGDVVMVGGTAYVILKANDARRVEAVSAAAGGRHDESYRRPRGADEPVMQQRRHGPHRIVVWST
jgi:co-chaperonin GroES (HSP10)